MCARQHKITANQWHQCAFACSGRMPLTSAEKLLQSAWSTYVVCARNDWHGLQCGLLQSAWSAYAVCASNNWPGLQCGLLQSAWSAYAVRASNHWPGLYVVCA